MFFDTLSEEVGIVNSLSSRNDLFTATEHIIRVGVFWIDGVRHGIKWANLKREFIEDICKVLGFLQTERTKISVILFFDKFAQELLLWCTKQLDGVNVRHTSCR